MTLMFRPVTDEDAARLAEMYNHYIRHTIITFEEQEIEASEMVARMGKVRELKLPWLVAFDSQGRLVGYAYATRWRYRPAYRHTVETAIYLDHEATGNGWGKQLYARLLDELRQLQSIHEVVGLISEPNPASVRLHRSLGFEDVGVYRRVGRKFDRWIDVRSLQLTIREGDPVDFPAQ